MHVGPIGLSNGAFDSYMIYFFVVISALSLSVKVGIGTSGDCEDCAMSGEGISLLWGLFDPEQERRMRRWEMVAREDNKCEGLEGAKKLQ
jgi:hypothetical protein